MEKLKEYFSQTEVWGLKLKDLEEKGDAGKYSTADFRVYMEWLEKEDDQANFLGDSYGDAATEEEKERIRIVKVTKKTVGFMQDKIRERNPETEALLFKWGFITEPVNGSVRIMKRYLDIMKDGTTSSYRIQELIDEYGLDYFEPSTHTDMLNATK